MTVYVDDTANPLGRMRMCHMVADSTEELQAMATRLGLRPEWIQAEGTPREHFDVCKAKRRQAVAFGAVEIDRRDLVRIIQERRTRGRGSFLADPMRVSRHRRPSLGTGA